MRRGLDEYALRAFVQSFLHRYLMLLRLLQWIHPSSWLGMGIRVQIDILPLSICILCTCFYTELPSIFESELDTPDPQHFDS